MTLLLLDIVVRIAQQHRILDTAGRIFDSAHHIHKEPTRKIRNHHPQRGCLLYPQAASHMIGMEVQCFHGVLNLGHHDRAYYLFSVDHSGNGGNRDARQTRNISHRIGAFVRYLVHTVVMLIGLHAEAQHNKSNRFVFPVEDRARLGALQDDWRSNKSFAISDL